MTTVKRLFRNTSILVLAKGMQPVISLFLIITITKKLGVSGLGSYVVILSFVEIFQIIAAFGLRNLITREVARDRSSAYRYYRVVPVIALGSASIAAGLMIGAVLILGKEAVVKDGTILISLSLVAAAVAEAYEGILGGFEHLSRVGFAWFLENFFRVIVSIALLYLGFGLFALLWVYILVRYLKAGYYHLYLRRLIEPTEFEWSWSSVARLLREAQVFALIMICVMVYWKADVVMLQAMKTTAEVGLYSAAYRIFMMTRVLVTGFMESFFPVIAGYFARSPKRFESASKKAIRFLLVATLPVAVLLSLFADVVIVLIFGNELAESARVLKILMWVLIPYGVSQVFAYTLVSSGRQKYDLYVNGLSMASNIVLNYILIPKYSYLGAAWATLISIHIYVLFQIPFVFPSLIRLRVHNTVGVGVKLLIAAAAMVGLIYATRGWPFWISGAVASAGYLATVLALRVLPGDDLQLLREVTARSR